MILCLAVPFDDDACVVLGEHTHHMQMLYLCEKRIDLFLYYMVHKNMNQHTYDILLLVQYNVVWNKRVQYM